MNYQARDVKIVFVESEVNMGKIKELFSAVGQCIKRNGAAAIILSAALGVLSALAVTALIVMNLKSGVIAADTGGVFSAENTSSFKVPVATVSEEVSSEAPAVVQPVEKQVEYKGKSVNVVKPQVANANSKEDAKNGSYVAEHTKPKAQTGTAVRTDNTIKYKSPGDPCSGGIDVSSHNGSIDWEKVKASGVEFAMIRCGYRGYLTGKIVTDACFDYNICNACKNGIEVGIYFYSTATNETEALEEAAYVTELIKAVEQKGVTLAYPVAYDFEEFYNRDERTRAKDLSAAQISKNTDAFLDFIKSSGYKPMLYAGKNPVSTYWQPWVVSKYDFWLAHYTEATEYKGKFFMWQYTSSGAVDGISGAVDLDICGFENNDNLPRFLIAKNAGVKAYAKPKSYATVLITLENDTVYLCRNTYDTDYKELKIAGKYYYVFANELSEIPFAETPDVSYTTLADTPLYSQPFDDTYKTSVLMPAGTAVDVKGVWGDKWAKIEYEEKTYYIKPDMLQSEPLPPDDGTPDDSPPPDGDPPQDEGDEET